MLVRVLLWLTLSGLSPVGYSQPVSSYPLEARLEACLAGSGLSPGNRLRLSAWIELKGRDKGSGLSVRFGEWGQLDIYPTNWLLRTAGHRIYHLDRRRPRSQEVRYLNQALDQLFERIPLLAQGTADPALVALVDAGLARKPIEPFTKLYLRHLLIHHGHLEEGQRVVFSSVGLPQGGRTPVRLVLEGETLRGQYLRSGGRAAVTDVDRPVAYASGEAQAPHIAAFKLLAHALFEETAPLVAAHTEPAPAKAPPGPRGPYRPDGLPASPYPPDRWIGMMLAQLRAHNLSIGDPEILPYLLDTPYFPAIYARLSPSERAEVDRFCR